MSDSSWTTYYGFRIDDCRRTKGCYKIRTPDKRYHVIIDFSSVAAAKAFIRQNYVRRGAK